MSKITNSQGEATSAITLIDPRNADQKVKVTGASGDKKLEVTNQDIISALEAQTDLLTEIRDLFTIFVESLK